MSSFGVSTPATYTAIALSNRFDLTTPPSKGGGDCGEYRIVFERNSGAADPKNRNLIIFEAVLPNPHPSPEFAQGMQADSGFLGVPDRPRIRRSPGTRKPKELCKLSTGESPPQQRFPLQPHGRPSCPARISSS